MTRKLIVYEMELDDLEKARDRAEDDDSEIAAKIRWLREKIDEIDNLWTH